MRLALMVSAAALMAGAALAQAPATPPKEPPPQVDPPTTILRIDTNQDGAASREEWVAYGNHDSGFTAIDTNKDGRVTVAELTVFRNRPKPAAAGAASATPAVAAPAAHLPLLDPVVTVRLADTDRDGAVSEAEWVAYGNHGGAGFTPVDADHDGKVTTAELTAYRNRPKPAAVAEAPARP